MTWTRIADQPRPVPVSIRRMQLALAMRRHPPGDTYAELDPLYVATDDKTAAQRALRLATKAHNLPPITVHYFVDDTDHRARYSVSVPFEGAWHLAGQVYPAAATDHLWVKVGKHRTRRDIAFTVLHEARHVWQYRTRHWEDHRDPLRDEEWAQRDADHWADYAIELLQMRLSPEPTWWEFVSPDPYP